MKTKDQPEKVIGMKNQRELLKKAGAVYTPGHGWAIPDPNTGTCWWDDSSYNGTVYLGANAREAIERLRELDMKSD